VGHSKVETLGCLFLIAFPIGLAVPAYTKIIAAVQARGGELSFGGHILALGVCLLVGAAISLASVAVIGVVVWTLIKVGEVVERRRQGNSGSGPN
jgi:hypothetical protein